MKKSDHVLKCRPELRSIIIDTHPSSPLIQIQAPCINYESGVECGQKLIDLLDLYAAKLSDSVLGLAWNQTIYAVNNPQAIFIYRTDPTMSFRMMINPRIMTYSETSDIAQEGCVSMPGKHRNVRRSTQITVVHLNSDNVRVTEYFKDWEARVVQHEYDHIAHGILMTDKRRK